MTIKNSSENQLFFVYMKIERQKNNVHLNFYNIEINFWYRIKISISAKRVTIHTKKKCYYLYYNVKLITFLHYFRNMWVELILKMQV